MTSTQTPAVASAAAIAARAKARTDAERRPGRIGASIDTFGRTTRLGASALRYAVTDIVSLRFPLREMLSQAWFIITVTAIPGILMAIPFGVIVSTQVGNLVHQLGASSMIGAAGGMGVIKQGAPVATGLLLG
ncbi:MAG: ABC transporter permease, partial [Gordonia amarae]